MNLPWVESPFFEEILKSKDLSVEQKKLATEYHENGFIVLQGLFADPLIQEVKSEMENKGYNPDFKMRTDRDSVRIQDLWLYSDSVKSMACNKQVLETLKMLYDKEPIPFQTLNFKRGSQQRAHSDTIHFSSIPAKYMCGVWVALEDINEENGAVYYYPKSQNLPEYNFAHFKKEPNDTSYKNYPEYEDFIEKILDANGFERKPFYAKKGDVLIWSSNIIHGGSPLLNPNSTRYSQVTHYYFEDCIYFTPMLSNMVTNELYLRKGIKNIKTGKKEKQSFNGTPIKYVRTGKDKFVLSNRIGALSRFFIWLGV